jgi:hypothetical protein
MTVDGQTKRRTLLTTMRYSLRAQSAPLVRGCSRRIMTLRFRPAHIRVINRRDSPTAVISPAFRQPRAGPENKKSKTVDLKFIGGLDRSLHISSTGFSLCL